ncbi:MAG TPA: hypothetical protein PLV92_10765 [Pirellulaceae bacterium]|nr:hypothetical protein [Pirellulaceae bacterium]
MVDLNRDEDDVEQTLAGSSYELVSGTPYLRFKAVAALPSLYGRSDAVTVSFVAGYGDNPGAVPADFLRPLLFIVADLYRYRETLSPGGVEALPSAVTVDRLLQNFRSPFA